MRRNSPDEWSDEDSETPWGEEEILTNEVRDRARVNARRTHRRRRRRSAPRRAMP
jgi:hypothetical protein